MLISITSTSIVRKAFYLAWLYRMMMTPDYDWPSQNLSAGCVKRCLNPLYCVVTIHPEPLLWLYVHPFKHPCNVCVHKPLSCSAHVCVLCVTAFHYHLYYVRGCTWLSTFNACAMYVLGRGREIVHSMPLRCVWEREIKEREGRR